MKRFALIGVVLVAFAAARPAAAMPLGLRTAIWGIAAAQRGEQEPEAVEVVVTFDANGGTGAMAAQIYTNGVARALPANEFSRTGHAFVGWATSAGGVVEYVDGQIISPADSVMLYAVWNVNSYTVTFNANGGTGGKTVTQDYGTAIVAPTVTREGYAFAGWQPALLETVPAQDVTYTAQWTENAPPPPPLDPIPGTITVTTEATAAGRVMRLVFHRTGGSDGRIAVKVKTQTSTGICGTDFAYVKEVLVWEDGDASDKVIEIPTYASGAGKQLRVKLATLTTGAYAGCVTPKLAESKVYAEMTTPNPGTITVTAPDPLSVEAGETLRMTLSRTGGSDGKIAVKAKTQTSTALMGVNGSADFDYVKKTFEWGDGDATDRTLDIPTYVQPWEGVKMLRVKLATLATGTYAGNLTPALAESKVYAEIESPVAFGTVYVAPETARPAAGETLRLVFRRTGGSDYPIAVKYKVQTSTAVAGTDFEYKKGVVTWGDGEADEKVVEVPTYPSAVGKQLRVKLSTLTQGAYEGCVTPHLNAAKVYVPLR